MPRFPHSDRYQRIGLRILIALVVLATLRATFAADSAEEKNVARMNCGAQIECTMPDGRVTEVATSSAQKNIAAAVVMDNDTLSCRLEEGQTTFVIKLPAAFVLDRLAFVNENAAAAGELKISVSNCELPATSPKWTDVDGHVSFSNKRFFNLSMVGVEARYIRLAFEVRTPGRIGALGVYGGKSAAASFSARISSVERAMAAR